LATASICLVAGCRSRLAGRVCDRDSRLDRVRGRAPPCADLARTGRLRLRHCRPRIRNRARACEQPRPARADRSGDCICRTRPARYVPVRYTPGRHPPDWPDVTIWIVCSAAAALTLARSGLGLARAPALGLAAGLLFAGGDISAKLVVYGGVWFVAVIALIACYALGTSVLQGAFQHGNALTAAGLATLATNAVPIAAGFVIFGERLPHGMKGAIQLAAFACLVISAAFLARAIAPTAGASRRR
jgi:hypothetical protein